MGLCCTKRENDACELDAVPSTEGKSHACSLDFNPVQRDIDWSCKMIDSVLHCHPMNTQLVKNQAEHMSKSDEICEESDLCYLKDVSAALSSSPMVQSFMCAILLWCSLDHIHSFLPEFLHGKLWVLACCVICVKSPVNSVLASKLNTSQEGYSKSKNMTITADDRAAAIAELRQLFPGTPLEELHRFLTATSGDVCQATTMLRKTLEWRSGPGTTDKLDDALKKTQPSGHLTAGGLARDGTRVLFVQVKRYDNKLEAPHTYALATAGLLERSIPSGHEGRFTVLVDVREAHGWPNPTTWQLLPFIKDVCGILKDNFPERLARVIVYPVPWFANVLWSEVQKVMDPKTAAKVQLFANAPEAGENDVPPEVGRWVSLSSLPEVVHSRHKSLQDA